MRKFSLVAVSMFLVLTGYAQPRAVKGVAELQGKKLPAAVLELPYAADMLEDAISEAMSGKGYTGTKFKDFKVYRSVEAVHGNARYDVYIKAERKSRKDKEASVVYALLGKPNEVVSEASAGSESAVEDGKDLLNELVPKIAAYQLKLDIAAQEAFVAKMQKKETELLQDSTDLSTKLKQLNDKVLENQAALQKQRDSLEKEKQKLEAIRSRKEK